MKQKILLTGATSFLGTRLQQYIPMEMYDVIAISKIQANLADFDNIKTLVTNSKPDIVIHAGALVNLSRDFEIGKQCFEVNTFGTMHLLEALKEKPPQRFIYISSEEVYGNGPIPFREDQKLDPPSPYAISKVAAEHLCNWYGKEYNFPINIVRLGTFYGPQQPPQKYFSQIILHALHNEPIPVNSGIKKRDYIYVDDAVELLIRLLSLESRDSYTVNATGGKSYQLLEVIAMIKQLTNSQSEVQIGAIPDRITEREEWLADNSAAKKLSDWEPKVSLEEGLEKMIIWIKKQN